MHPNRMGLLAGAIIMAAIIVAGTFALVSRYDFMVLRDSGRFSGSFLLHDRWSRTLRTCGYTYLDDESPLEIDCKKIQPPP